LNYADNQSEALSDAQPVSCIVLISRHYNIDKRPLIHKKNSHFDAKFQHKP